MTPAPPPERAPMTAPHSPNPLPRAVPPALHDTYAAFQDVRDLGSTSWFLVPRPADDPPLVALRTALDVNLRQLQLGSSFSLGVPAWDGAQVRAFRGVFRRQGRGKYATYHQVWDELVLLRRGLRFDVRRLVLTPAEVPTAWAPTPPLRRLDVPATWQLRGDDPADADLLLDDALVREWTALATPCELYANGAEIAVFAPVHLDAGELRRCAAVVDAAITRAEARIQVGEHDGRPAEVGEGLFDTSRRLPTAGDGHQPLSRYLERPFGAWLAVIGAGGSVAALVAALGLFLGGLRFWNTRAWEVAAGASALGALLALCGGLGVLSSLWALIRSRSSAPSLPLHGAPTLFLRDPRLLSVRPGPTDHAWFWRVEGAVLGAGAASGDERILLRIGVDRPLPSVVLYGRLVSVETPPGHQRLDEDLETGLRGAAADPSAAERLVDRHFRRAVRDTLGDRAIVALGHREVVISCPKPAYPGAVQDLVTVLTCLLVRWDRRLASDGAEIAPMRSEEAA